MEHEIDPVVPPTETEGGTQEPQPVGEAPQEPELSPFEQQLAAIEAEKTVLKEQLAERERQIAIKDKALKKKEENLDPDVEKRLMDKLEAKLQERDRESEIKSITSDEAAQKLIKHHLEHTIRPSGNVTQDIQTAWAIVNAKATQELLQKQASYEAYEELVSNSQMGGGAASNAQPRSLSPARRQAEELLRAINPEAIKHLKI